MAKKKTKTKVAKTTSKKAAKKTVKKAPAKKAATKKAATKKTPVKKAAVKKVPAKKAAVKKTLTKTESAAVVKAATLKVGDQAPEFKLYDQNGNEVSLQQFRGKNVLVYFYPKAMTPGCTVQACSLRDSQNTLAAHNIVVLGISADPVKSLKKFEEKEKLNFTLLSDPDHKVIEAYGAWGPKQFMGRTFDGIHRQSFLINAEGKLIHVMYKVDTKTHHDDVLAIFKAQG
jgi:peroxiredoxin Q/BCP